MPGLWNSFEEERDKSVRQSRHRLQGQRLLQKRQLAGLQELIVERLIQLIVQERFLKEERLILKEGFVEFVEVIIVGLLIRRSSIQSEGSLHYEHCSAVEPPMIFHRGGIARSTEAPKGKQQLTHAETRRTRPLTIPAATVAACC